MTSSYRTTPPLAPRSPGRPAGETTLQRERLLDTALAAFSHQGIATSSLRGIASAAGVTPALVNYYFGNKEKLLAAVVEERLIPLLMGLGQSMRSAV
jgi:TetR/AcrR family transcriptional regulator